MTGIYHDERQTLDRIEKLCYPKTNYNPWLQTETTENDAINRNNTLSGSGCVYPLIKKLLDLTLDNKLKSRRSPDGFDKIVNMLKSVPGGEVLVKKHWTMEDYDEIKDLEGKNIFLRKEKRSGLLKVHKHIPLNDFELARKEILYTFQLRHPLIVPVEGIFKFNRNVIKLTAM